MTHRTSSTLNHINWAFFVAFWNWESSLMLSGKSRRKTNESRHRRLVSCQMMQLIIGGSRFQLLETVICRTLCKNRFCTSIKPSVDPIGCKKKAASHTFSRVWFSFAFRYVLVYKKGYQQFSDINSSVTTKLKGVAFPNFTDDQFKVPYPEVYKKVWDQPDYVVPPQVSNILDQSTLKL